MYEKVFEQAESFFKPVNDILELNAATFDVLRAKNSDLVNEVFSDSIECAKGLAQPNINIDTTVSAQQEYFQNLQNKLTSGAQNNVEVINDFQGKVSKLLKSAIETNGQVAKAAVEPVNSPTETKPPKTRKKQPAKKTSVKNQTKATVDNKEVAVKPEKD